jgi:cardiolipin synthase A/B
MRRDRLCELCDVPLGGIAPRNKNEWNGNCKGQPIAVPTLTVKGEIACNPRRCEVSSRVFDNLLAILSLVLGYVWAPLSLAATAVAIYRGHGVERTLAWIFAIWAIPIGGAVAYFAFAQPSVRRVRRRMRAASESVRLVSGNVEFMKSGHGRKRVQALDGPLLHLAHQVTGLPPTEGNQVELLAEDQQAFQRMELAIKAAQRFIWAEYYIIGNDVTGRRFLGLLANKARKGVSVRLLYDAVGSLGLDAKRLAAIRKAGGRAEAFLPLNPLRRRWSVHLRNHRKFVVVDGEIGFTGGMNVADQYSGRARRRGQWHFRDYHLALRGPAVGDLASEFIEDWAFATDELLEMPPISPPVPGASSVVAVVPSGPDQETNASGMIYFSGIAAARQRIYLTTPYFVPDEPTVKALVSAALRGLDVRILLPAPERNDVRLVAFAARSYFAELIRGGVRIFEYQAATLHTKSLVVDGAWGIVGSANVDLRSFRLNFELSALVSDPAFAKVLEERFQRDLADSREVTADMLDRYGFWSRLGDRTLRLLSPLL